MPKTLLLTGGTGFLGSNLLKKLLSENYRIVLAKRSFSNIWRISDNISKVKFYDIDRQDLSVIFDEQKIDVILHCATDYGRKQVNPLQIIEANLILPLKLLQLGKERGVKYFINTDTVLDKRVNDYTLSKKQFIDWLGTYKHDLVCINMALEHFFGPGDDKTKFVSFILDNLYNNVDKIDLTKGEQKRDFVYIDDVVSAFMVVINNLDKWRHGFFHYEVGTNQLTSIKEFVGKIKAIIGNGKTLLNFGALPYREGEVMTSSADTTAIHLLGWSPRYDVDSGLRETIAMENKLRNI
ncbi:MAG: NAD-dependent epimerase/dehydratase family protein [Candidatus Magasanikbacteria bacterium]